MKTLALNDDRFLGLLKDLVAVAPRLQNAPSAGLIPEERLAADIVLRALAPAIKSGFLDAVAAAAPGQESRPSLVITVPGTGKDTLGFVGAHFDVVPADREREGWERDPFALHVGDDGTLYGRGVTDCLGRIAVLTDLLAQMAERGERPTKTLTVVMIANEEDQAIPEIGLDYVVRAGKMDSLKGGPVYWLDSADFGPTIGTAGVTGWELLVSGVAGHSGMPQNCVNALELAMAASLALSSHFRKAFPPHPDEARYGFLSPSSLKATIVHAANQKVTKIPGEVKVVGDVRLTPFYEMSAAVASIRTFIEDLDARLERGETPPGFPSVRTSDGRRGRLALKADARATEGIACDLDSPALAALTRAIQRARGDDGAKPFSVTGSLPLVRDLQRKGFDLQITGFGRSGWYHAPNEQASLSHFREGFTILRELLDA
jgi:acetylornithine deacetylase/succinyl-diaminopimelate desuccinylase-like protein